MLTWEQLKEASVNHYFHGSELRTCCKALYGGVAYPNRSGGFTVLIAVSEPLGSLKNYHEIVLLHEFESFDLRELILECGRLDVECEPDCWVGDTSHGAAEEFIAQYNEEADRPFNLTPSYLRDVDGDGTRMSPMYPYILGMIKPLIELKQRRLFLKDGRVVNYLGTIAPSEIAELEGTLPAVEALGYALDEALRNLKVPIVAQTHTGADPEHAKTFRDLAVSGAIDDLDEDDEEDED